jgi:AcrR family transcriptional regulator
MKKNRNNMTEVVTKSCITSEVDETRQRILDASEAIFSEIGYEATTVRAICELASVKNIGAVNYYFQGKENLYRETVKNALRMCSEGAPFPVWAPNTPPSEKLRDFIRVMMSRVLRAARVSQIKLMMREFTEPSQACREAVKEYIQPIAQVMHGILTELLPEMPIERRWLVGFSIVGQCLYYRQNRAVAEILIGADAIAQLELERLADHIAAFSLAALGFAPPLGTGQVPLGGST